MLPPDLSVRPGLDLRDMGTDLGRATVGATIHRIVVVVELNEAGCRTSRI